MLAQAAPVPAGNRGAVTSASQESKLEPTNILQEFHGQKHNLDGRTEFTVNCTKLEEKNNVSYVIHMVPIMRRKLLAVK